jgi:hypothetical protein
MPKSGIAQQWCPCGSNLRPHLALAIRCQSLHVNPPVRCGQATVYICPACAEKFDRAITEQQNFFRVVNARTRDRILGVAASSLVGVWEAIESDVPG